VLINTSAIGPEEELLLVKAVTPASEICALAVHSLAKDSIDKIKKSNNSILKDINSMNKKSYEEKLIDFIDSTKKPSYISYEEKLIDFIANTKIPSHIYEELINMIDKEYPFAKNIIKAYKVFNGKYNNNYRLISELNDLYL
jgi:hypothetical protein